MSVQRFQLINFRNYIEETIEFVPGTNVLIGQNGQGKTNILEGLYYLLTGKSYRVQREQELVRWGEKGFHLYGGFTLAKQHLVNLESHYQDKKKSISINGVPCRRLSDYLGTINVVFFTPDDLALVKGGPVERRNFLDLFIAQITPAHISVLNAYNKALMQKSALLRTPGERRQKKVQVALWNDQLLHYGQKIIQTRSRFTEQMEKAACQVYDRLSSQTEKMSLAYHPLGFSHQETALEQFPVLLEKKIDEEIDKEMILVGPHRDDIKIQLNSKSARQYGSQGQQRSLVLSLKLAELEIIQQEKGESPLLLLDDVLSELDGKRRDYLMDYINHARIQSIITMTSAERQIKTDSLFEIDHGMVRRIH